MPKSVYRINAMIAVSDPSLDREATHDSRGNIKIPAYAGVRMVRAGEPIELDDDIGRLHLGRHGGSVEEKPSKKASAPVPAPAPKAKSED